MEMSGNCDCDGMLLMNLIFLRISRHVWHGLLTLCIQHPWDVKVFLCDVECEVQVIERMILSKRKRKTQTKQNESLGDNFRDNMRVYQINSFLPL
jgi:hypothetical protein